MIKSKRKIKGYRILDAYEIMDIYGSYSAYFEVYRNGKYIGIAMFN